MNLGIAQNIQKPQTILQRNNKIVNTFEFTT